MYSIQDLLQVVEIELGEHVEMMLSDGTMREDHYGVMEVTELFEDEKVYSYILIQLACQT